MFKYVWLKKEDDIVQNRSEGSQTILITWYWTIMASVTDLFIFETCFFVALEPVLELAL